MTKKEVAFIVVYFPTISETFIVNQINSLLDEGVKVQLYAYNKIDLKISHESFKQHNLLDRVQYFIKPPESKLARFGIFCQWIVKHFFRIRWGTFFKTLNLFKYGKQAYTLKLFFEAQWFLLPHAFKIVHAHFGMSGNRIAYLQEIGILPNDMSLITSFHGYDLVPNQLEEYKKEYVSLLKEAVAFTVNTPYLENLLQQINTYGKPIFILPVGLDISFFKKEGMEKSTDTFDITFCGKLIELKGPDLAIEIVKRLNDKGYGHVRLHIVGNGNLINELEHLVNTNEMKTQVLFHGAMSQGAYKSLLEQSDVFLLPGRKEPKTGRAETQGLVIQEAQSMELPVVVSDVGGMPYGLLPNESGFVLPEGDVEGFVKAIEKLILDPELKISMGKKGREFIKRYDMKVLGRELLDFYGSLERE